MSNNYIRDNYKTWKRIEGGILLSPLGFKIKIGINVIFGDYFSAENCGVVIGNNVNIGDDVSLFEKVVIGNNVNIGNNVVLLSNVIIGDNVTIGDNVIIHHCVTIENNVIVDNDVYIESYNIISEGDKKYFLPIIVDKNSKKDDEADLKPKKSNLIKVQRELIF